MLPWEQSAGAGFLLGEYHVKIRSRRLRLAAAAFSVALLATACGGDTETDDPATEDDAGDEAEDTGDDTGDEEMDDEETDDEDAAAGGGADGTLDLAYILPETGQLAFLGPPMIGAVELAVDDINAAGGVLGSDVTLATGDEAGDTTVATQTAQRLLGEGVDAIVGAASSSMSLSIIDAVTGAGVTQCSPSNTSATFTNYDDNGLYFRTAPSDALQGPVLANIVLADGFTNVALLARADDYGQGLLNVVADTFTEGGGTVAAEITYDPEAANFDAEVQQAIDSGADSVVLISFDEAAQILSTMIENGVGPGSDIGVYGAESLKSTDLPSLVDENNPNVIDGLKGTAPGASPEADSAFVDRLIEEKGVEDTLFAPEAYDCTVIIALAAQAAQSDAGTDIAAEMVNVTVDGTACATFEECSALLEEGEDINYNGVSGTTDFRSMGEPANGFYEVWEFVDGEPVVLDVREAQLQ